jgi:hypothetical protein
MVSAFKHLADYLETRVHIHSNKSISANLCNIHMLIEDINAQVLSSRVINKNQLQGSFKRSSYIIVGDMDLTLEIWSWKKCHLFIIFK